MLTLKKVKELVNAPVHTKRVPSPKVLLEEGRIFLRKEFEHGSHLTLYHNGYVWFSAGKRNTVFHIHDCRGDYAYGASKGKGEVIKEEYFENCEWHIRALFEGEQRVEESLFCVVFLSAGQCAIGNGDSFVPHASVARNGSTSNADRWICDFYDTAGGRRRGSTSGTGGSNASIGMVHIRCQTRIARLWNCLNKSNALIVERISIFSTMRVFHSAGM